MNATDSGLNLDARQRAMLEEMGVKVWWPSAPTVDAKTQVETETEAEAPPLSPRSPPLAAPRPPHQPAAIAPRSTPVPAGRPPAAASSTGAADVLADMPRRLYVESGMAAAGVAQGGWLIVADMPPDADGRHGEPLTGDAGRLLDNMLRALQLHGGALPVHLMRTHRGIASGREGSPQPFVETFATHANALAPRMILAMGPLAAQSLLQSTDPLGRLRGRATPLAALNGTPVVATYHPAYLLRNTADKARAWADLGLAADRLAPQR